MDEQNWTIGRRTMRRTTTHVLACLFIASHLGGAAVLADSVFTIENPPVDCEVIDAEPFDGFGDNGPYSTFNDVLLGTLGECRSMAEFDISPFSVPQGEYISSATLKVVITATEIYGLGVNGETPESLGVDGYVGNGVEELSDFEAGDGNLLDSVPTPNPEIGQLLTFDVTSFVTEMVNAQEQWVGLTLRAETFGGLWVTEGDVYPKLTIETTTVSCVGDIDGDGDTDQSDLGMLLADWGCDDPVNGCDGDLDGDDDTDQSDLGILLGDWGCTP
jgi:hypothetical protein